ncbi:MAG: CFI-box-CTERM domain-containing protein [Dehalococcoidia bacterium]|jgi:hypothetical protein
MKTSYSGRVFFSIAFVLIFASLGLSAKNITASTSPSKLVLASDLKQQVTVDACKLAQGFTYYVITNSSDKLITISFDFKFYDKDKSYLGGGKWDLYDQDNYPVHPFILPRSTTGFRGTNMAWDSFAVSNISVEELTNPFPILGGGIEVYDNITFAEGPTLGTYKTLDPKWGLGPQSVDSYIVGEIQNTGIKTPSYLRFHTIFSYKGKVVGVFEGGNSMSSGVLPPPGEKMKFRSGLGGPPKSPVGTPMPDIYDSFKTSIICWSLVPESSVAKPTTVNPIIPSIPAKPEPLPQPDLILPPPKPSSTNCFIATAAYGTPLAKQIDILRDFRDRVLVTNVIGTDFVNFYYSTSPPIADVIAQNELLKLLTRDLLIEPIVFILDATKPIWHPIPE